MSRTSSKISEENHRLRTELKKLKSEINHLKKTSNSFFPFQEKQKLALQVQEKLDQGIFSPPKLPTRTKSPVSHSRSSSKSPTFKPKTSFYEPNKENLPSFGEKSRSPSSSFMKVDKKKISEPLCSLNDTSRQNIDELQTLERENMILRELKSLRKENEILRSQIKLKTPKSVLQVKKKHVKGKISELDDQSFSSPTKKSPVQNALKKTRQRSAKKIKNRVITHKHSVSLIYKSPSKSKKNRSPSLCSKNRSPSVCSKSPNASFSESFSFTGSTRKQKMNPDLIDLPRSFERSPSMTSSRLNSNVTPRSKNCWNCDNLLHKGLSTSFCEKRHYD